jgi:rhomboid protease GluP
VTATTFGKRGLAPPPTSAAPRFKPASAATGVEDAPEREPRSSERADRQASFLDHVPILTLGLIAFLLVIFALERRFAFDIERGGALSLESLIALGGASYDRVVGDRQIWRLFLAPLLHASTSHVVGNCIALFFVGLRLEKMIGRAWIAAIFVASAFGGEIGSLLGNPHATITVGASGAISGLIGALFVVSFEAHDPVQQRKMLLTAMRFGIPALAPLLFGRSGHTDYCAHSAGAVTGAAVGWLVSANWPVDRRRPNFTFEAAIGSLIGLGASLGACLFAASQYAGHAELAARSIPSAELAGDPKQLVGRASELLARYPNDPRAHLTQALAFMKGRDLPDAEVELRRAMALAANDPGSEPIRDYMQTVLAVVVAGEGRTRESKAMVADLCAARAKGKTGLPGDILGGSKLCE